VSGRGVAVLLAGPQTDGTRTLANRTPPGCNQRGAVLDPTFHPGGKTLAQAGKQLSGGLQAAPSQHPKTARWGPGGDSRRHRVVQGGRTAERVRLRDITTDVGNRLLRIVRRSCGSVVTWRRAQMVLLSAQAMDVAVIAQVTLTGQGRVRDVLHNFNLDGFDSLYPRSAGGRPPTFTLAQRRAIKKAALSRPVDHDLPFST
jgi:hypothetical protein